jgi:hypothetical protein
MRGGGRSGDGHLVSALLTCKEISIFGTHTFTSLYLTSNSFAFRNLTPKLRILSIREFLLFIEFFSVSFFQAKWSDQSAPSCYVCFEHSRSRVPAEPAAVVARYCARRRCPARESINAVKHPKNLPQAMADSSTLAVSTGGSAKV